ncbi:protein-glutamate methylesterase/protein-glutamine glutaminase [Desulfoplanes sp.]
MPKNTLKVLVVDDSALVRSAIKELLESDPHIEVVGTAADPFAAAKRLSQIVPDVITLDVEMPRMDGLTFLRKIMTQHPIPVVMCSSLTIKGTDTLIKALEYGAVDVIEKPKLGTKKFFEDSRIQIIDTIKAAAKAAVKPKRNLPDIAPEPKLSADAVISSTAKKSFSLQTTEKVVIVGASTGGTEALRIFLQALPHDCPAIAIVQHMPEMFTASFAKRLDEICTISVKEAEDNDTLLRGHALIAPGNRHMLLNRSGTRYYVSMKDGPLVQRHRPSVDVLFRSAARYAGPNGIGVIMTGMGDDGAAGMKEMFDAGAMTIAQDEASCVVFGMPKEAIKTGGVHKILSLQKIAPAIL